MGDVGTSIMPSGRGAVVGRHVLVDDAPHVAAFAAEDPLERALGFRVHLGVQLLRHVEGHEGAEVAAFGGVGGQGVVQPKLVEQHQVPHEGVDAGFREHVAGRRDEEDLVPLLVERRIDMDTGDGFDIFGRGISTISLKAWGWMARWLPVRLQLDTGP